MSYEHLRTKPFQLADGYWYYQEKDGLQIYSNGGHLATIPWREVRDALMRKNRRKPSPKRKSR